MKYSKIIKPNRLYIVRYFKIKNTNPIVFSNNISLKVSSLQSEDVAESGYIQKLYNNKIVFLNAQIE